MKEISHFFAIRTSVPAETQSRAFRRSESGAWQPPVDIYECDRDGLVVLAELPGIEKDQITVDVQNGRLRIMGQRPNRHPHTARVCHHLEIDYGPFLRIIQLPPWADERQIEANYEDGYLMVTIGRKDSE